MRGRSRSSTREDDAEQPVPADGQPEQIRVLRARAPANGAVRPHEVECLHLADDRFEIQAAPVRVARQGAANAESIRAGLFLNDAPLPGPPLLHPAQMANQLRPFDAALNRDHAALFVEGQHAIHRAHVDEDAGFAELLSAHGMTAAGDRHRLAGGSCVRDAGARSHRASRA